MRIGTGFDVHAFTKDRPLVLGGVHIPSELGLLGHSDADVILHATMDAMLGALAMGDIGQLFPNTDPRYRGADSTKLASVVWERVEAAGYQMGNLDVAVMAETPKLSPYVLQIRQRMALIFKCDPSQISVKATTMEKLGFVGRREGIAATAVVLLEKRDDRSE